MMPEPLDEFERVALLKIARQTLSAAVRGAHLPQLDLTSLPARLREEGTCFVTLLYQGALRGCVGSLEANQPLAENLQANVVAAAFSDPRFPPVQESELADIFIEISCLTPLQPVSYEDPHELLERLRPGIDGILISDGIRRATFLPKVWEKIPDASLFLSQLCQKMGAPPDLWRYRLLEVATYQTDTFSES